MKPYFEGYYFKHRKGGHTVAFIAGVALGHSFVQMVTEDASYRFRFPVSAYKRRGSRIEIAGCRFGRKGINILLSQDGVRVKGKIRYSEITPVKYDIMGPFSLFKMQCCHSIVSLDHRLTGTISLNGRVMDFTDGRGYIEGDRGRSFPSEYTWLQCNDFKEKCSVTAAVAKIPTLFGCTFRGCICAVYYQNREYRLATYLGVKVIRCDKNCLILKQGKYCLKVSLSPQGGQELLAPEEGEMSRIVFETAACYGRFCFYEGERELFDFSSNGVSFEYMGLKV